ncbi:transcription factor S [Natronorarus salvus]|uniref:transcription factor S n=1 Tax=Natronorarus salvus TaxID=3117733 RepID=UPI002F267C35
MSAPSLFCPECGSMTTAEGDRRVCTNDDCGAESARDAEGEAVYTSTEKQADSEVIETEEGAEFEGKPTAETVCEGCGHDRAYYTIKQTASADEPPTRFFKCTECGYRWREYN